VRERVTKGFGECQTGEWAGGLVVSRARRPRTIRMCSVDGAQWETNQTTLPEGETSKLGRIITMFGEGQGRRVQP